MAWADVIGHAYRRHVAGECSTDELLATIRQFRPAATAVVDVSRGTVIRSEPTPEAPPPDHPPDH